MKSIQSPVSFGSILFLMNLNDFGYDLLFWYPYHTNGLFWDSESIFWDAYHTFGMWPSFSETPISLSACEIHSGTLEIHSGTTETHSGTTEIHSGTTENWLRSDWLPALAWRHLISQVPYKAVRVLCWDNSSYVIIIVQLAKLVYFDGFEHRECLRTLSFGKCCRLH